jgi:hypothetical protein
MRRSTKRTVKLPPWKRNNPRQRRGTSHHLTDAQKRAARDRARRAGRPYPNLVDNMWAARTRSTHGA